MSSDPTWGEIGGEALMMVAARMIDLAEWLEERGWEIVDVVNRIDPDGASVQRLRRDADDPPRLGRMVSGKVSGLLGGRDG